MTPTESTPARACPKCGAAIAANALGGLCPNCLVLVTFDEESAATVAKSLTPAVAGPRSQISNLQSQIPAPLSSSIRYFGDYELLEEIARGGMGVVYKARQVKLNRVVAVKMILSGKFATDADVLRFQTEAEAAANLQHPNIVAIHEVGEHEGRHYFSMDYVEGRNLAEIVKDGPLPPAKAAPYVKTIAEAIHFAHQRGTLHRDLKPHNVLIDRQGQPRITDFGLAKHTERDSGLTQSGAVLGSPGYMPPEQATGRHQEVGPASDIYSLGAMLYHLLTGRAPFAAGTPLEIIRQVVETEPIPPTKLNPKTPPDLETICLKCLEKRPERRYRTALELAEELQRFLDYEPILARPAGRLRKTWSWAQQKPWVFAALFGSLLFVLAGVAYGLWENSQALTRQLQTTNDRLFGARYQAWLWRMEAAKDPLEKSTLLAMRPHPGRNAPAPEGESPSRFFFVVFPVVCFLLHLFGKAFRRLHSQRATGGIPVRWTHLLFHGATGIAGAVAGMSYLLIQIRAWVRNTSPPHMFALEQAAALCSLVLMGIGFRMVWEALGMHETSRFRSSVDTAMQRQLADESRGWPAFKLIGFGLWLLSFVSGLCLLLYLLFDHARGLDLVIGVAGMLCGIGLVVVVTWIVRRRFRLLTFVFAPLALAAFAFWIGALTLSSETASTTYFCTALSAMITLPGLLFFGGRDTFSASQRSCFPVKPWVDALYGLVFFIAMFGLFQVEENWRGRREWARVKAELLAKNEPLDLAPFLKPPVPDEENVMAHPYMKRYFLRGTKLFPIAHPAYEGWTVDAGPYRLDALRKLPRQPASDFAAAKPSLQGILDWYSRYRDEFGQLEEALGRPQSLLRGDSRDLLAAPIPNLVSFRLAAQGYANLCMVLLLMVYDDGAVNILRLLRRLMDAEAANELPLLVTAMFKVALVGLFTEVVEQTLANGLWPSSHLAQVQKLCEEVDLLADVSRSLRGERVGLFSTMQTWSEEGKSRDFLLEIDSPQTNRSPFVRWIQKTIIAEGWVDQNRAHYARLMQSYLEGLNAATGRLDVRVLKLGARRSDEELHANTFSRLHLLARIGLPNIVKALRETAMNQTLMNEAYLACALERHRAAKGGYPGNIEALVPEFVGRLPDDVLDGRPLRYRRTDNGKYLLYSIGWNLKDDQGEMPARKDRKSEWQDEKGDWVWQGVPERERAGHRDWRGTLSECQLLFPPPIRRRHAWICMGTTPNVDTR